MSEITNIFLEIRINIYLLFTTIKKDAYIQFRQINKLAKNCPNFILRIIFYCFILFEIVKRTMRVDICTCSKSRI